MICSEKNWASSGHCSQAGVVQAGQMPPGAGQGLLPGQLLPLSEPQGGLGWMSLGYPVPSVLRPEDGHWNANYQVCQLPAAPTHRGHSGGSALSLFASLVYPSLESDEDSPVFKSRSKKRKASDDAPYSPTGSAGMSGLCLHLTGNHGRFGSVQAQTRHRLSASFLGPGA